MLEAYLTEHWIFLVEYLGLGEALRGKRVGVLKTRACEKSNIYCYKDRLFHPIFQLVARIPCWPISIYK